MSDIAMNPRKVSREGVILIKSFEGFRPRATQRSDGGWVIGYGHTASAREGLSVSEADAELLLQYDLLPVVKSLNEIAAPLNQHQYDALASFAFSVGVDRFRTSDVLAHLSAGAPSEAADALVNWSDTSEEALTPRRRAAERALFFAVPGNPVALADLLSAPLPPPPAAPEVPAPFPSADDLQSETLADTPSGQDAVEALIATPVSPFPSMEAEGVVEAPAAPAPEPSTPKAPQPPLLHAAAAFYSPYGVRMTRPLTGLGNSNPTASPPPSEESASEAEVVEDIPTQDTADQAVEASATAPADEPVMESLPLAPQDEAPHLPQFNLSDTAPASTFQTSWGTAAPTTTSASFSASGFPPATEEAAPVTESVMQEEPAPAPLVLTPPEPMTSEPARPVWPDEARESPVNEDPLFDQDGTESGLSLHYPSQSAAKRGFGWSESNSFIVMGGIGLVSFGAAMAAFRSAGERGGDTTTIGWVLAIIALSCVGVSGYNLYQRWGRPERS